MPSCIKSSMVIYNLALFLQRSQARRTLRQPAKSFEKESECSGKSDRNVIHRVGLHHYLLNVSNCCQETTSPILLYIFYLYMTIYIYNLSTICDSSKCYIASPPLFFCLGSPAASNVPLLSLLIPCAELCAEDIHVTLCPLPFINSALDLSNPNSKTISFGIS